MLFVFVLVGYTYCNGTWDGILCWPAAQVGQTIRQPCPPLRGLDLTSKYSIRKQMLFTVIKIDVCNDEKVDHMD